MFIKNLFDYAKIQNWLRSPAAIRIAFLWGLAEATFFFIVPDVFFAFSALMVPLYGLGLGVVSIAGTVVGGLILFQLAQANPALMEQFLIHIPGIPLTMVHSVHADLHMRGFQALLLAPLDGLPYKTFAVGAGIIHMDLVQFLLVTIPARLERVILVWLIAAGLGKICRTSIKSHTKPWVIGYVVFWVLFYILYAYLIDKKY